MVTGIVYKIDIAHTASGSVPNDFLITTWVIP